MVYVKLLRDTYGGEKYLRNACAYVENSERYICGGGYGVDPYNLSYAYNQMMGVKRYFSKTSGNPLLHFVVSYDRSVSDPFSAADISNTVVSYFTPEYQLLWCVHGKDRGCSHYHTHIVLNSVSYVNGKMFHSGPAEMNAFARYVGTVTGQTCRWGFSLD